MPRDILEHFHQYRLVTKTFFGIPNSQQNYKKYIQFSTARWSPIITMTSHVRHAFSNHQSSHCLYNSLCGPASKRQKSPHYWPFVRGIHRWPVNFPHKGPVTQKQLPYDDVIIPRFKLCRHNTEQFRDWHLVDSAPISATSFIQMH